MCGSGGPGALAAGSRLEGPGGRPGAEWRALRMVLEEPVPRAGHEASAPSVGSPVRRRRQPERGCWAAGQAGPSGSLWALRVAAGPQSRAQPSGLGLRRAPDITGGRGATGHTPPRRPEVGMSAPQVGVHLHCICAPV